MTVRVLVADDDPVTCALLSESLTREGYEVEVASGGREALELGTAKPFDVALVDIMMPDLDGPDVLRALKEVSPATIVIMMTAFGSFETAIATIKEGAYDYVAKPFEFEKINVIIHRALERQQLILENLRFKQELKGKYRLENIVGASEGMLEVYKMVARVASTRSTVLIQGETGTGKELIARAIHYNSPRAEGAFVA
ncbi:MAG: sigma-54-dependent Fis family transcriptional regulator, partial [Candidatus Tectomicrobia bacterium]|nr:sigma-54-dependent Fis family transcriptional regulator [Candidatus Tectomicrobia bacterium]